MSDSQKILEVDGLCFSYHDKENVLTSLSFDLKRGETMGVIGPNGAGKTTLFMVLCGVLKPDSGNVRVNGKHVEYRRFNPKIGYVFQNPDDQLFSPCVWDDVAFGPINMGLKNDEVDSRVIETLEKCGCQHLAKRPSHHLSGGEKRMVAIASVLSMQPELVIYDEPSSNLDMRSRRKVIELIEESGATDIIASHDLEFVRELSHKLLLIEGGKLIAKGKPDNIMGDKNLMAASGLEVPYSLRFPCA